MNFDSRYKKASNRIVRRRKLRHLYSISLKVGIPLVIIFCMFYLVNADFLQINNIVVRGNSSVESDSIVEVSKNYISQKKYFLFPKSNYLTLSKSELQDLLLNAFPRIENVNISKKINRTLEIDIKERVGQYIWCSVSDDCYLMSSNGLVFTKADSLDALSKIVFKGVIDGDPVMKYFTDEESMKRYLNIVSRFKDKSIEVTEMKVEYSNKLSLTTGVGLIILNPEEDMDRQATNILLLIEDNSQKGNKNFEYIDARLS